MLYLAQPLSCLTQGCSPPPPLKSRLSVKSIKNGVLISNGLSSWEREGVLGEYFPKKLESAANFIDVFQTCFQY